MEIQNPKQSLIAQTGNTTGSPSWRSSCLNTSNGDERNGGGSGGGTGCNPPGTGTSSGEGACGAVAPTKWLPKWLSKKWLSKKSEQAPAEASGAFPDARLDEVTPDDVAPEDAATGSGAGSITTTCEGGLA